MTLAVFPTPVGMNRRQPMLDGWCGCVPHARGDEPQICLSCPMAALCSPRPWG